MKLKNLAFISLAGMSLVPGVALAQDQDDVPGKGVARLSLLTGDVSVRRGDTGEWVAAAVNGPLVAGDHVLSGGGSRTEIQFDWANLIRLSSDTEIRLPQIDQNRYQIEVARGIVTFSVLQDNDAQVDINTSSVSIRPVRKGMYRVEVHDDGSGIITEVSVRSGEAEIYSPRGSQRLRSGRTMMIRGDFNDPEFQNVADAPDDEWDGWNERRDRELVNSQSSRYVPRDVYGVNDLDAYGSWVYSAPYGYVWAPRVAAGWSPYRHGRWSWVDYYGWSWISYDPWGWAPYHYGRWFWNANRWCWWPGAIGARTFWRPALVAWVGWGGGTGVNIGVGFGGGWGRVGWVPLAPYEPFYPWYGRRWYGNRAVNHTTIVNNINITNVYRNARVNNGVTVVQAQNFGRGHVENLRLASGELDRAASARGPLPIVPDRTSTRMADREARAVPPQRSAENQRFFSRTQTPAAQRVSFDEQRRGMEQVTRQAFGDRAGDRPAVAASGAAGQEGSRGVAGGRQAPNSPSPASGWRRIGESAPNRGAATTATPNSPGPTNRMDSLREQNPQREQNGWQRFGEPRNSGAVAGSRGSLGRMDRGERSVPGDQQPQERQSFTGSDRSRDGWTRFGSLPPNSQTNRGGMDRSQQPMNRMDRGGGMDRGNEVRINPPIVRDRDGGDSSFSRGYSRGFESRQPAPRMDAPRPGFDRSPMQRSAPQFRSAPAPQMRSAPSMGGGGRGSSPSMGGNSGGGGGGGGGRSGGGSGGSGRSGGGGGRR